jgi:hypothetical protein
VTSRNPLDQVEEGDLEGHVVPGGRELHLGARPEPRPKRIDLVERLGHPLEALVLQEPPREVEAGILLGRSRWPGQEHPGLHVDELRRQRDVLRRHVQVELLHRVEVGGVLLGDPRDRDVGDRHLVDADQVEEQVERAGERLGVDRRKGALLPASSAITVR